MKATEILEKIADVLQLSATEVKLESMKLDNGTVIEAESFEGGNEVFIVTEDERVALPVGEYELEDGRMLIVKEEGVIDSVTSKEEEPKPEAEAEVEAEEEVKEEEPSYVSKEEFSQLVGIVSELAEKVEAMMPKEETSEESDKTEEPKEELSKEVELSSEEPSVDSFKHSPEKQEVKNEGFKLSAKRQKTVLDNVLTFLNK